MWMFAVFSRVFVTYRCVKCIKFLFTKRLKLWVMLICCSSFSTYIHFCFPFSIYGSSTELAELQFIVSEPLQRQTSSVTSASTAIWCQNMSESLSWPLRHHSSSVTGVSESKELTYLSSQLYSPLTKYKSEFKQRKREDGWQAESPGSICHKLDTVMVHFST